MKKNNKNYFTQETEDAIILYNKTESSHKRSLIYEKNIHYPFFKLTQNIIHTFKFYHTEVEELEDLQHEIIVFLLSKIHLYSHVGNVQKRINKIITKDFKCKYNGDFGEYVNYADRVTKHQINEFINSLHISDDKEIEKKCKSKLKLITPPKAYSYFGTIVKRWLILYNNKNYSKKLKYSPIEDLYQDDNYSYYLDNDIPEIEDLSDFIDKFIQYVTDNLYEIFNKEENAKIADVILELFRQRKTIEDLDVFNKKISYIYIREMYPNIKTPKITKIANELRGVFYRNYNFFLENGYVDFDKNVVS